MSQKAAQPKAIGIILNNIAYYPRSNDQRMLEYLLNHPEGKTNREVNDFLQYSPLFRMENIASGKDPIINILGENAKGEILYVISFIGRLLLEKLKSF